jgi:hypothetical protein
VGGAGPPHRIALGTISGGWRIVHTLGQRITELRPARGMAAETGTAVSLWSGLQRTTRSLHFDPDQARPPWSGLPVGGDNGWLPGMIAAGQAREEGQWAFWDVHDPERAVIIDLADERYTRLVIEVDDPWATATTINQAVMGSPRRRHAGSG